MSFLPELWGKLFLIWTEGLRIEAVVCCTDCEVSLKLIYRLCYLVMFVLFYTNILCFVFVFVFAFFFLSSDRSHLLQQSDESPIVESSQDSWVLLESGPLSDFKQTSRSLKSNSGDILLIIHLLKQLLIVDFNETKKENSAFTGNYFYWWINLY